MYSQAAQRASSQLVQSASGARLTDRKSERKPSVAPRGSVTGAARGEAKADMELEALLRVKEEDIRVREEMVHKVKLAHDTAVKMLREQVQALQLQFRGPTV